MEQPILERWKAELSNGLFGLRCESLATPLIRDAQSGKFRSSSDPTLAPGVNRTRSRIRLVTFLSTARLFPNALGSFCSPYKGFETFNVFSITVKS